MNNVLPCLQEYSAWSAPADWLAGVFCETRKGVRVRLPSQVARYKETQRLKMEAIAIAEGRDPRKVGAPKKAWTPEREAALHARKRRKSLNAQAKKKALRAAAAIAKGFQPGSKRRLSDEERAVARAKTFKSYRERNLDALREKDAAKRRENRAQKAILEGRVPGIIGRKATFTAEYLAEYDLLWPAETKPFHPAIHTQNARAKNLGVPGRVTGADVRSIYAEQAGHCAFCAKPLGEKLPELDHWMPLSGGGTNHPENIKLLHRGCNRTKGARLPETFVVHADNQEFTL